MHFAPHLIMVAIILTGQVIPPRRPKGSKSKPSSKPDGAKAQAGHPTSSSLAPAAPVQESQRPKAA